MRALVRVTMLAVVVSLGLTATACRLNPMERPTVRVTGVTVGSISFTGVDGVVDLSIYNPNAVGLPLEAMAWRLTVSGQSAVTGRAELAETIPARQNASVRARIHIGAGAAPALASAIAGGAVTYHLDATFTFRTQIGALSVETSTDGTLRR